MRNLKRALSLALASIMLLGMMVVGSSAASINDFSDVDSINNKEAVAIATGLGIFDGYDTGDFKPENVVTRAEMAVIIAKILHGSDVDPSNFAGAGKFTDVPAWAEGYVNLCAALNIIVGVGEGKFAPNQTVTTAEASTMLLKALGYYVGGTDALGSDWNLEVTSKATSLGLYGDLSLAMNAGLTRENVAVLTFNALFAQRVAYDDYRGLYVKSNDRNVVVTNGTDDELNTLAYSTYGLYMAEGIVVDNGATNVKLSESLKSKAQTTVMFTEETDLNKDGKFEYDEDDTYDFEVETGLDMIGHAAKVYYKIEKKAPVVFALVDQATLAEHITYNTNSTKLAEAANDAGFKKNTILDIKEDDYIVNYDMDTRYDDLAAKDQFLSNGKDLIVVSNSGNKQVDYVIALHQFLDVVSDVDDDDDFTEYTLKLTRGDNYALADVDEDDYVVVTDIGLKGTYYAFEPATVIDSNITKLTGKTNSSATITKVTADGVVYTESNVLPNSGDAALDNIRAFAAIETIGEATLILDQYGKLIAIVAEKAVPNYAYVSEYGIRHSTSGLNTKDVLTAKVYFADGTNGIYEVDVAGSDALSSITSAQIQYADEAIKAALNGSKLTYKTIMDKSTSATVTVDNQGTTKTVTAARGLYNVKVKSNDTITINELSTFVGTPGIYTDIAQTVANSHTVKLVKAHSTLLNNDTTPITNVTTNGIKIDGQAATLYQNNDTVYFYINCDMNGSNLVVKTVTGIKNAKGFTNGANEYDSAKADATGIVETYASKVGSRAVVKTMLVANVDLGDASNIYYHDVEDYSITKVESGKYAVTYKVYDNKTGEASEVTYDNNGKYWSSVSAAKTHAENNYDGFYTLGSNDLVKYAAISDDYDNYKMETKSSTTYITNDDADYDEYVDNLFGKQSKLGAILDQDSVIIVDICDSGLTNVNKLVKAIKETNLAKKGDVDISFTWNADYETFVIFVTSYDPDEIDAPGRDDVSDVVTVGGSLSQNTGDDKLKVDLTASNTSDSAVTIPAGATVNYTVYQLAGTTWLKLTSAAEKTTAAATVAANADNATLTLTGVSGIINNVTAKENGSYKVEISISAKGITTISGEAFGAF